MKHNSRTFYASALVMALAAITCAQAGGTAGGTVTPGAGPMKAPNERGYGSPDVMSSGVGEARSSPPTGRCNRGKANGLNMGTRSGANSDVNRPRNCPKENGQ
jgi:hypothetical protein